MAKSGELTYLSAMGERGKSHAFNKPFSDQQAGRLFIDLGMIRNLLPAPPVRLLDLGCGTGWTSCFFALMGYEVVGQDIAPDMIELADANKDRYNAKSVSFIVSDYESLDFQEEFDAACFYDSLHHAEDERLALEAVFKALKPGGVLLAHEPGDGHSVAEHSVRAMENFDVTEKDMPPYHIMDLATEIGFSSGRYFPFPSDVVKCLELEGDRPLATKGAPSQGWMSQVQSRLSRTWIRMKQRRRINRLMNKTARAGGITLLTK